MAASVATRAALLGLASLLLLMLLEAGAMRDEKRQHHQQQESSSTSSSSSPSPSSSSSSEKHHVHHKPSLQVLQHKLAAGAVHGNKELLPRPVPSHPTSHRQQHNVKKRSHRHHEKHSGETYLNSSFSRGSKRQALHGRGDDDYEEDASSEYSEGEPYHPIPIVAGESATSEDVRPPEPHDPDLSPGAVPDHNISEIADKLTHNPYSNTTSIATDLSEDELNPILSSNQTSKYFPPTAECSSCQMRDFRRNYSLEVIKEQILQKLGMKHAPNTTGRVMPNIPHLAEILDRYGMQSDAPFIPGAHRYEEEDDYHVKTSMAISVAQTTKLRHDMNILHFRFSERTMRSRAIDAKLYVHIPPGHPRVKIELLRVLANASEHESVTLSTGVGSKYYQLHSHRSTWIEMDASSLVQSWFKNPRENLGIVINLIEDQGRLIPHQSGEKHQPFIKVNLSDGKKPRMKRTVGLTCEVDSSETRCCRYSLTVDFEEFGWDWIIAPKKYDANFCAGECPYVFLQRYPHTHIVQQANPTGSAGPCCAPRKLSSINMLYFDNDFNIIFGLLPGMVVDRCGCQ